MNASPAGGPRVSAAATLPGGRCRSASGGAAGTVVADLRFARGGGRTFLAWQSVPYPFHITRPHYLDLALPDLATLYMQSASGGLYRGDRLSLSIGAGPGARAHITSQAATVVHTATGSGVQVDTQIDVARGAVLALTTDPYILFPGTELSVTTEVSLASGAVAILAEGFSVHDPVARERPFTRLATACRIRDEAGRILLDERSRLEGTAFLGAASPLGCYRAMGTLLLLGQAVTALDPAHLEASLDGTGVLAGCSPLPNAAGWGVRLLARDGGHLRRGTETAYTLGFEALVGARPERRRK